MPLHSVWGYWPIQTESHIHLTQIQVQGVWALSPVVLWWIGIWMHTYTITTTTFLPDLGELAEIVGDVSV